ncbi:hypothetical protein GCM10010399_93050 [Dactylosporangium fulvum]|uniref:Transposase n=1 Tax=Dactylosporangium fulvum TaxID=53359 RepID=A0ABY5W929_9ACTN|nr:hypothetical protein [Dactylosporangium fulvum]UWP85821.1 hypothetical protein Dfulv_16875 [Dactylosporangium fulvum]
MYANGNKIPAPRASTDERHRATRAELRQRYERRDLRDALNEARGLIHFDRVLVGA